MISNTMRTRREVLKMFQHKDAETEMLAMYVKSIVHCFLEPIVDEGFTAREVMGFSVDTDSVV
jgi:hypothetical protein